MTAPKRSLHSWRTMFPFSRLMRRTWCRHCTTSFPSSSPCLGMPTGLVAKGKGRPSLKARLGLGA